MSENVSEIIKEWKEIEAQRALLQAQLEGVNEKISALTLRAKMSVEEQGVESVTLDGIRAGWVEGRASYDYKSAALELNPAPEILAKHTESIVNWTAVCTDSGLTKEIKEKYRVPGRKSFVIGITSVKTK